MLCTIYIFLAGKIGDCAETGASDPLARGISLYNKKDYANAQDLLFKAVSGEHKNAAIAHYYYANTLMQLRRTNAALDEYESSYRLAPFSAFSGYCRMMLLRYGRDPEKGQASASSKASPLAESSKASAPLEPQSKDMQPAAAERKPDHELADVLARMPKPVTIVRENPSVSEIMSNTLSFRSSFLSEAEQRKSRALEKLEQGRKNLTRAESVIHSYVPSVKAFGEAEETFKVRRAESEKIASTALEPFRENIRELERIFESESNLYENCLNASRGWQQ